MLIVANFRHRPPRRRPSSGENGVDRLENRLGKPLEDMIRAVVLNVISIVISGVSSGPPSMGGEVGIPKRLKELGD